MEALQGDVPSTDCQAFGRHSAAILKFSPAGMLTLWQAMTGGLDWASVMSPLLEPHPHQSDCAVVGCCAGYSTFLGLLQSEACNCGGSMVCLFFLRSFVDSHVSVASVFDSC